MTNQLSKQNLFFWAKRHVLPRHLLPGDHLHLLGYPCPVHTKCKHLKGLFCLWLSLYLRSSWSLDFQWQKMIKTKMIAGLRPVYTTPTLPRYQGSSSLYRLIKRFNPNKISWHCDDHKMHVNKCSLLARGLPEMFQIRLRLLGFSLPVY